MVDFAAFLKLDHAVLPKADILPQFGGMLRDIPKKETTPVALRWMNDMRSATGLYQGFFTISCEFFFSFWPFKILA